MASPVPPGRGARPHWAVWLVVAAAGLAAVLAGRAANRSPRPAQAPTASIADETAIAQAVAVNGRLQYADAAYEADEPSAARAAVEQAATWTARDAVGGPAGALSAAFHSYVAAEDALGAGDRSAARAAYATADAAFEAALDGGALPAVVEPTHLFSEAGVLYVDGQATLEAGDVAGALTLLRAAESKRGKPFRPLLLTVEARAAALTATPTP